MVFIFLIIYNIKYLGNYYIYLKQKFYQYLSKINLITNFADFAKISLSSIIELFVCMCVCMCILPRNFL